MKIKKNKYIAVFFQSFGGTYKKIGSTSFKLDDKYQFKYKGKVFTKLLDI